MSSLSSSLFSSSSITGNLQPQWTFSIPYILQTLSKHTQAENWCGLTLLQAPPAAPDSPGRAWWRFPRWPSAWRPSLLSAGPPLQPDGPFPSAPGAAWRHTGQAYWVACAGNWMSAKEITFAAVKRCESWTTLLKFAKEAEDLKKIKDHGKSNRRTAKNAEQMLAKIN